MSKNYQHEVGYETLLKDFEGYRKQTPRGITLARKSSGIYLQFKTPNKDRRQYACNCEFTIDGMISAVQKARKVAEALKGYSTESEFWEWYNREIKEEVDLENDLKTFAECIAVVEDDFWSRPDRRKRKRDKNNPSDQSSWYDTYNRFYKHLPQDKVINLKDILEVVNRQKKGSKTYKGVVSAMKRLARMNKRKAILDELNSLDVTQTKFRDLQAITLDEFLAWRDKVLAITTTLHPNTNLEVRKAWLWVYSMQIVYGLRIHEVFAIQNLYKPFTSTDNTEIPALSDEANQDNLIVIGKFTAMGTTTKTGYRISAPITPPRYSGLITMLDIKNPLMPENKSRSKTANGNINYYNKAAWDKLHRWNCPTTETHAFRHLANHNGMQAGMPLEVRAQSMGHTPAMNDSTYKKRKRTQTTIDLLLKSNTNAIDYVHALEEARKVVKQECDPYIAIGELMARIYGKNAADIVKLLKK